MITPRAWGDLYDHPLFGMLRLEHLAYRMYQVEDL